MAVSDAKRQERERAPRRERKRRYEQRQQSGGAVLRIEVVETRFVA
jgi:hypothetical protein